MANLTLNKASRVIIAASLSALITACASNNAPRLGAATPIDEPRIGGADIEYQGEYPSAFVDTSDLNPDAPESYTVKDGDTLWDISGRFLKGAWKWPQIWDYNPQIQNPHLIYPGDKLFLTYVNGQPTLSLIRNGQSVANGGVGGVRSSGNATRVSPKIRVESLSEAVPTIPGDAIKQFLVRPNVVTGSQLKNAPYVVGNEEGRLISSLGQEIFVRGDVDHSQPKFGIFRKTKSLKDPRTGKFLGFEVIHVAEAKLMNVGDPSTMVITSNSREIMSGDVLLPSVNDGMTHNYTPRMPPLEGAGRIVSLVDAISQSSRDRIIVVNVGKKIGIEVGDVLAIESRGESIIDRHGKRAYDRVKTPNKRTGVVMIFQTFDDVSYGLVMESSRTVKKNDIITGI